CKAFKHLYNKILGKLYLILIEDGRPWRSVVVDFKSMLVNKKGYNNILVIVD
ncbi:hypothetical protein GE21DRAFT_1209046, partial [Neurospora crassa]